MRLIIHSVLREVGAVLLGDGLLLTLFVSTKIETLGVKVLDINWLIWRLSGAD